MVENSEASENIRGRPHIALISVLVTAGVSAIALLQLSISEHASVLLVRAFAAIVLSLLPGYLFLRFLTVRTSSVWEEFVLNLHRLGVDKAEHLPEPPTNSMYHEQWLVARRHARREEDRLNIYVSKFEAYYGPGTATYARARARDIRGDRFETLVPALIATAMFAAGWVAALYGSSVIALPATPTTFDLLRIGFVGAYLFALQMLVRRYFQADLRAGAFVTAVVRVVMSLALVAVAANSLLRHMTHGEQVGVAFVIGFFPLVGLQALQKTAAVALRTAVPSLKNDYPLSDLDGLSVWYEVRLLELGIEDMENLATANLVDVILYSRVPVGRLVDWVDQALLYLHLEPRERRKLGRRRDGSGRRELRVLGIRTATGLQSAFARTTNGAAAGGLVSARNNEELLEGLRWALNANGRPRASVTESLLKTLESEPNLRHVESWKGDWRNPTPEAPSPTNGHRAPTLVAVLRPLLAPFAVSFVTRHR